MVITKCLTFDISPRKGGRTDVEGKVLCNAFQQANKVEVRLIQCHIINQFNVKQTLHHSTHKGSERQWKAFTLNYCEIPGLK